MIETRQHLKQFYRDYLKWVENGAPDDTPFSRKHGLCRNLYEWTKDRRVNAFELSSRMSNDFILAGLSKDYPFGGVSVFKLEYNKGVSHLNAARIGWCSNQLGQSRARYNHPRWKLLLAGACRRSK